MKRWAKLWAPLVLLVLLVPLGLEAPRLMGAGGAWGEWGVRTVQKLTGYAPAGMKRLSGLWRAPARGYRIAGMRGGLGYMASAAAGAAVIVIAGLAAGRALSRGRKRKKKEQGRNAKR